MTKEQLEAIREWKDRIDGGEPIEISINRDIIDVTPSDDIDPSWAYTDRAGHVHRYRKAKDGFYNITNTKSVLGYYPDGDTYHYPVCRFCGEPIAGGTRPVTIRREVAGLTHCYINGEEVSRDVAKAVSEHLARKK